MHASGLYALRFGLFFDFASIFMGAEFFRFIKNDECGL